MDDQCADCDEDRVVISILDGKGRCWKHHQKHWQDYKNRTRGKRDEE